MDLLTSNGNQYLRPEYLTPLPTTLDAKKSPLALLAQTCSQIGADPPTPGKGLHSISALTANRNSSSSLEGQNDDLRSPSSSSSSTASNTPSKDHHKKKSKGMGKSCTIMQEEKMKEHNHHSHKEKRKSSPTLDCEGPKPPPQKRARSRSSSIDEKERNGKDKSGSPSLSNSKKDLIAPPIPPTSKKDVTVSGKDKCSSSSVGSLLGPTVPFPSILPSSVHAPTIPPYLHSYARLKAAAEGSLCRDPFCTGCNFSSHQLSALASAAAAQGSLSSSSKDHSDLLTSTLSQHYSRAFPPLFPFPSLMPPVSSASSSIMGPYLCNWISAETAAYCGKRFSSSEELLQHLRSHTQSHNTPSSTHPYPTPPLSPLRYYHPYAKSFPLPPLPPTASSSTLPFGLGLSAYYPYFYGRGLGGGHP